MLTLIAVLALIGAVVLAFPRAGSLWGTSLVLVALAAAMFWYENITTGERWVFWPAFIVTFIVTFRQRWRYDRRVWVGALMLLLTIVLIVFDVSGLMLFLVALALVVLAVALVLLTMGAFALVALGTVIVLALGSIVAFVTGPTRSPDALATIGPGMTLQSPPTVTVTKPPVGTGTPTGVACPPAYVQVFDPNKAYRFYSDGVKTSAQDLEYLGHDARTLAFRAYTLKLVSTPDPSKLLEPGSKCLSRQGQDTYMQVKGALTGRGTKVDNDGAAPADGYNTGMKDGQAVVDTTRGIRGDRSAIVYTLRDGSKLYVLHRCGNVVLPSPGKLPKGPTDNPKPKPKPAPSKTTPPAKCVEIPGNGKMDCESKDPSDEPAARGNVPPSVQGTAPAPAPTADEPAVARPAATSKYTPPPEPAPTTVKRTTPPPTVEPSAPPSTSPEPSPTVDPCTVNPDFC